LLKGARAVKPLESENILPGFLAFSAENQNRAKRKMRKQGPEIVLTKGSG
jgi:hypothetical protein